MSARSPNSRLVRSAVAIALGLTLAWSVRGDAQAVRDTLAPRIDAIFSDVNTTHSPGCSLGVVRNGVVVYARDYGMADLDANVPLSPSSRFYIASTSKQFTAASVLLLAQEGKLSLDDDVRKYIPELPNYGAPITIQHLLHHTSGIRDYLGLFQLGAGRMNDLLSDDDVIALIARQKALNFPPGSEYVYSNSGYFLLGQIVKRVTGTSLREYADAHIFRPLGMVHTQFHDDRRQGIANRVLGYDPRGHGFVVDYYGNFQGVGDGGLWSTVADLALWDQNFYDPRVGGAALLKAQLTPGRLTNGDTITYASGLMLGRYRGLATVTHGGAFMGYRSELLRFPAQHLSVICLCNLSTSNPSTRAHQVADIFLANEFPGTVASVDSSRADDHVQLAGSTLDAVAGSYRQTTTGMVLTVALKNGALTASALGALIELAPLSDVHFRSVRFPVPIDLLFEPAAAGRPSRVRFQIGNDAAPELFERFEPIALDHARLLEYAGRYASRELGAVYEVTVSGDDLYVTIPNRPKQTMTPTVRDAFTTEDMSFTFVRDGKGRLTTLVLSTPRDRNIHFEREGSGSR